jgi:hypothetical protein
VATAASYTTDVKTLHFMLDEQRQLIESLKANLSRSGSRCESAPRK